MNRRQFLRGAVVLAPAVILTPGLLMPVRTLSSAPMVGEYGKFMGFDFVELAINPPAIMQRADLEGAPWQIYSTAKFGRKVYDFAELRNFILAPTSADIARHAKIARLAFARAARRDS